MYFEQFRFLVSGSTLDGTIFMLVLTIIVGPHNREKFMQNVFTIKSTISGM